MGKSEPCCEYDANHFKSGGKVHCYCLKLGSSGGSVLIWEHEWREKCPKLKKGAE